MRHKALSNKRFGGRRAIVLAAVLGVAVSATPALAKPAGKRIAVLPPSDGTAKDAVITAKIGKALKQHQIQAVMGAKVKKALGQGGTPSSDDDWSVLARKLKVDGAIESTVSKTGAKRKVEVVVRNGADGMVVERATFSAKGAPAKLAAAVAGGFWKKLGSAVKGTMPPLKTERGVGRAARDVQASAPAAETSEEAASAAQQPEEAVASASAEQPGEAGDGKGQEKEAAEEEDDEGDKKAPPARKRLAGDEVEADKEKPSTGPRTVEVELGGRLLQRLFEYSPASAANSYIQRSMPVLVGRAAWFPITYAGVFVSGEFGSWLKSGSNPSYPTGASELVVGAQGRYPWSFGLVGLSAAYFQHHFVLGDDAGTASAPRDRLAWPDVAYQGVRIAASGRFYLGDMFQVGAEAAYRLVSNAGEGGTRVRSSYYFPAGSVTAGLDGSAFVGVSVMSWLEIRLGADYRRYVFGSLQPGSDNANNTSASGATDEYLGYYLSVVGVYGGR